MIWIKSHKPRPPHKPMKYEVRLDVSGNITIPKSTGKVPPAPPVPPKAAKENCMTKCARTVGNAPLKAQIQCLTTCAKAKKGKKKGKKRRKK